MSESDIRADVLVIGCGIAGAAAALEAAEAGLRTVVLTKDARAHIRSGVRVEVEAANLLQVREALAAGADMIMLDNMPLETMRQAVVLAGGRVPLEASGNMTLDRVRAVAETGVDFISVGALTHSARAVDISLDFLN